MISIGQYEVKRKENIAFDEHFRVASSGLKDSVSASVNTCFSNDLMAG